MGRIRTVGLVVKRDHPRATNLAKRIVAFLRRRRVTVLVDEESLERHGVEVVVADLLHDGELIRHDPAKLARAVLTQASPRVGAGAGER